MLDILSRRISPDALDEMELIFCIERKFSTLNLLVVYLDMAQVVLIKIKGHDGIISTLRVLEQLEQETNHR